MNCLGFETFLTDLLEGQPDQRLAQAARRHREDCVECSELWTALVRDQPTGPDLDLTRRILHDTSGLPCNRVRKILKSKDLAISHELVSKHLGGCRECRLWGLWMAWQQPRADSTGARRGGSFQRYLSDVFKELWHRPRFGFEAAYAGTLLFFLLLGGPGEVPRLLQAAGQISPVELVSAPINQRLDAWTQLGSREFEAVRSGLGAKLEVGEQKLTASWLILDRQIELGQARLSEAQDRASLHLNQLLEALADKGLWNASEPAVDSVR